MQIVQLFVDGQRVELFKDEEHYSYTDNSKCERH